MNIHLDHYYQDLTLDSISTDVRPYEFNWFFPAIDFKWQEADINAMTWHLKSGQPLHRRRVTNFTDWYVYKSPSLK